MVGGAGFPPVFGSASLDWGLAEWPPVGCWGGVPCVGSLIGQVRQVGRVGQIGRPSDTDGVHNQRLWWK